MTEEKHCERCGRCCMVLPLFTQRMHPKYREYLLNRGLEEDKEQGCILIPHVCQHLQAPHLLVAMNGKIMFVPRQETLMGYNTGKLTSAPDGHIIQTNEGYTCDIHDSPDRPEVCRKFHGQRIIKGSRIYVPPGCAYVTD